MAVYLVQSGGDGGRIKIGYAVDVAKRLAEVATASPHQLIVLAVIPDASQAEEKALHWRFRQFRRIREWFDPAPEILEFCEQHPTNVIVEPPRVERFGPVDVVRDRLGLATDADVAAFVGVIPQAVSAWRKRAKVPSDRHWQIVDKAVAQDLLPVEQAADFAREIWQASQPVNDPMKNEAA